jgi:hypothetical protein
MHTLRPRKVTMHCVCTSCKGESITSWILGILTLWEEVKLHIGIKKILVLHWSTTVITPKGVFGYIKPLLDWSGLS